MIKSPERHPDDYEPPEITTRLTDSPFSGNDWNRKPPENEPLLSGQIQFLQSVKIRNVEFVRELGKGFQGKVWQVYADFRHSSENEWERVALACKLIQHKELTEAGIDCSLRELRALKELRHDNICNYCEFIQIPDRYEGFPIASVAYFFELCDGSLESLLAENPIPDQFVSEWHLKIMASQVLDGLKYIHENGIYHKDIKQDNILYKVDPDWLTPNEDPHEYNNRYFASFFKLADFGISEILDLHSEPLGIGIKHDLFKLGYTIARYLCYEGIGFSPNGDHNYSFFSQYIRDTLPPNIDPFPHWLNISAELKSFLKICLGTYDRGHQKFLSLANSVQDLMQHEWLNLQQADTSANPAYYHDQDGYYQGENTGQVNYYQGENTGQVNYYQGENTGQVGYNQNYYTGQAENDPGPKNENF